MADRKYVSDYRLEDYVAPDGHRRQRRVYEGTYFRFALAPEKIRSFGLALFGQVVLAILLLLPLLFNNTQIGRTAYVILPMGFSLVPVYQLGAVSFRLRKLPERLTRQQRDLTDTRLKHASLGLLVLEGMTSIGTIVYWAVSGLQPGEWLPVLGVFLSTVLALGIFLQRNMARTEEIK